MSVQRPSQALPYAEGGCHVPAEDRASPRSTAIREPLGPGLLVSRSALAVRPCARQIHHSDHVSASLEARATMLRGSRVVQPETGLYGRWLASIDGGGRKMLGEFERNGRDSPQIIEI